MEKRCEQLYISPVECAATTDTAAIQAAVAKAKQLEVNVVLIGAKADGSAWQLTEPVRLPNYFTVIISGCAVESAGTIFVNEEADATVKTLGNEAHKIFILGRKGGKLVTTGDAPQIRLVNARDCRIAGLTLEGGAGIEGCYFRFSKLQMITVRGAKHAVKFTEGCNNIILESLDAETTEEAILAKGGASRALVKDPDICNSILCRIRTKTAGAPAVSLQAGQGDLYNVVVRDVTDETEAGGVSVVLGADGDAGQIRDITVRGVETNRGGVHTQALCDGCFYSNIRPAAGFQALTCAWKNTRELLEDKTMEIVLPQMKEELPDQEFVTPNDPKFYADGDAATIQNAIDYARAKGIRYVVIPCWNVRAQQARWDIEKTVFIPSYINMVNLGLTNNRWSLILPTLINVHNMIIMRTFFQNSIPGDLQEAAMLDGCSDFRYLLQIVLPLSKAVMSVLLLYYAVSHWNSYYSALLYIRDETKFPLQLVLRTILIASTSTDLTQIESSAAQAAMQNAGETMRYALIVIATVPILTVYPFIQKYFEKGVMIGSVKG